MLGKKSVSWPRIAKQLGAGVGTAYRAHQELSKNHNVETLSRIPNSATAVAD
jgi:predicted transcriptional regulator